MDEHERKKKMPNQLDLSGFMDRNVGENAEKIRRMKRRQRSRLVQNGFERSIRVILDSTKRNWIRADYILYVMDIVLRKLEDEQICYRKRMKKGELRVYKKWYCVRTLQDWKECPLRFCPAIKTRKCPYDED